MSLKVVDGRVYVQATVQTVQTADGKTVTIAVLPQDVLNSVPFVVPQSSSLPISLPHTLQHATHTTFPLAKENRPLLPKTASRYSNAQTQPPPPTFLPLQQPPTPICLPAPPPDIPSDPCPLSELLADTYQDWVSDTPVSDPCPVLEPNMPAQSYQYEQETRLCYGNQGPVQKCNENNCVDISVDGTNAVRLDLNTEELQMLDQFNSKITDLNKAMNQFDVSWEVRKKIPAILQLLDQKRNELLANIYQQRMGQNVCTNDQMSAAQTSAQFNPQVPPPPSQKEVEEKKKINSASCLQNRLECDIASVVTPNLEPFIDRIDAFDRLIPYHLLNEPFPSQNLLNQVDMHCDRIFRDQSNRIPQLYAKFQENLFEESMLECNSSDRLLISHLLHDEECSALNQDKSFAKSDLKAFLSSSPFLEHIKSEYTSIKEDTCHMSTTDDSHTDNVTNTSAGAIGNETAKFSDISEFSFGAEHSITEAAEKSTIASENASICRDNSAKIEDQECMGTPEERLAEESCRLVVGESMDETVETPVEVDSKSEPLVKVEASTAVESRTAPIKVKLKRKLSGCWRPWSPESRSVSPEHGPSHDCIPKLRIRIQREKMPVLVLKKVKTEVVDGLEQSDNDENDSWVKTVKRQFEVVPSPCASSGSEELN